MKFIKCIQNNKNFYIGVMNSEKIKKNCYISRRSEAEEGEKGFQRTLDSSRAQKIADYLDKKMGVIPSPIILSVQKESDFRYDENNNTIDFSDSQYNFLILDGQHRFYGLMKSENSYEIPIVIFENLKLKDEVNLFIDINNNQKGVSKNLLLEIKQYAESETSIEEKQREILVKLDTKSILMGKFTMEKSRANKLSNSVFYKETKSIMEDNIFNMRSTDFMYNILKNYYEVVEMKITSLSENKATLSKQMYFITFMNIFKEIYIHTLNKYGDFKTKSISEELGFLDKINFLEYKGSDTKARSLFLKILREEYEMSRLPHEEEDIY